MTAERDWPKCADCHEPITHFNTYFQDECPARSHLEPKYQGHQLTPEHWMALPFGPKETPT